MASPEIEEIALLNRFSPPNAPNVEISAPPRLTFLSPRALDNIEQRHRYDRPGTGGWLDPPSGINVKPNT